MTTRSQVIRDILDGFIVSNGEVAARIAEPVAQFLSMLLVLPFMAFVVKARRDDERVEEGAKTRPDFALNTARRTVVDTDEVW